MPPNIAFNLWTAKNTVGAPKLGVNLAYIKRKIRPWNALRRQIEMKY